MTRRSNECFPYARNYYKSFTPTCVTLSTTLCRRFCFFFLLQMGRLRYKLLDNLSQSETTLISIRARFWAWQSGFRGFLGDSNGKESACVAGDLGLIPGPGRSGEGKGYPLQYSCLENSMDRGYSPWGPQSPTGLSNWDFDGVSSGGRTGPWSSWSVGGRSWVAHTTHGDLQGPWRLFSYYVF